MGLMGFQCCAMKAPLGGERRRLAPQADPHTTHYRLMTDHYDSRSLSTDAAYRPVKYHDDDHEPVDHKDWELVHMQDAKVGLFHHVNYLFFREPKRANNLPRRALRVIVDYRADAGILETVIRSMFFMSCARTLDFYFACGPRNELIRHRKTAFLMSNVNVGDPVRFEQHELTSSYRVRFDKVMEIIKEEGGKRYSFYALIPGVSGLLGIHNCMTIGPALQRSFFDTG